jgi:hypothetical protein
MKKGLTETPITFALRRAVDDHPAVVFRLHSGVLPEVEYLVDHHPCPTDRRRS